jgi:hypothetical protein
LGPDEVAGTETGSSDRPEVDFLRAPIVQIGKAKTMLETMRERIRATSH